MGGVHKPRMDKTEWENTGKFLSIQLPGTNPTTAMGCHDGVVGQDGHPQAHQLVGVDLVALAGVGALHEGHHLHAGLDGVVARDEPHVAAPDDEHLLGGAHPIAPWDAFPGGKKKDTVGKKAINI